MDKEIFLEPSEELARTLSSKRQLQDESLAQNEAADAISNLSC